MATAQSPRTRTATGGPAGSAGSAGGGASLVIVESPAKAKKIAEFLGSGYIVESSIGHIRDLPSSAAEVPESYRGQAWAKLGVDVDNDFTPLYVIAADKKAQVAKLRALVKDASELYLATDEDREGESIAWHLLEVLKPKVPVKRMVFHEITREAIQRAVADSRTLDLDLVAAQEARRILDRLYGYEVSPVLWKKITAGLSAGRVQSVATRLVVERERARMRFRSASYWDLAGTFSPSTRAAETFSATMVSLDGRRLATGKDFGEDGLVKSTAVVVLDEAGARSLVERLDGAAFAVRSVEEKPYRRSPYAPFMTSTLQQEAGRKLRFSSQRTMGLAQRLYENGYITYMRTDSTTLSETALNAARSQVRELYGNEYLPDAPRTYAKKVKNAQEAHEAIRPAGESFRTPASLAGELNADELRLYELIWMRTIASQMNDARGMSVQVRLGATASVLAVGTQAGIDVQALDGVRDGRDCEFVASGKTITFPGFLRAYVEGADDPDAELEDREVILPTVAVGEGLRADSLRADGHSTQPPARYTEASLVKALEEMGVGRPSTYASIIGTIQNRGYVWKKGTALIPSFVAFAVIGLLEQHFGDLVDYEFTARMEDDLDTIAAGQAQSVPWLRRFYFGGGEGSAPASVGVGSPIVPGSSSPGLKEMVSTRLDDIDAATINSIAIGLDDDMVPIVVKPGRYGPYVKRGDDTAPVPDDLAPDELTVEKALELLAAPKGDRVVGVDPETGLSVLAKAGRFGPYVQLGDVETLVARAAELASLDAVGETPAAPAKGRKKKVEAPKPRTASLFASMAVDTVTLEQALSLLTLPRTLGIDEATGEEVVAQNGRYGPYLRKGVDSRSIGSEEELLTITLEQAMAIYAQPKTFGRRGAAPKPPMATFGEDPVSGKPIIMKEGRFGLYVTDGTTNASLRRGDDPETINVARAQELLAERRVYDLTKPAKTIARGGAKKAAPKKAAAPRKAVAKKAAAPKKAAAKKVAKGSAKSSTTTPTA
jgi:DNA topoisomerase I